MGGLRKLLTKSPAAVALGVLLVFVVAYLAVGQLRGRAPESAGPQPATGPAVRTQPFPSASRAPAPTTGTTRAPAPSGTAPKVMPTPASEAPAKPASAGVPTGPTGRSDPFIPLIRPGGSAQTPPPPTPPSPLVTLPPPPLPGGALPPPPLPGGGVPIPGPGTGLAVTGIVGNSGSVAVVVIDGRSEILTVGESIGDLRVVNIDAVRRTVRFSRSGKQFDVRMGGD
jgi:hypothetical protein